MKFNNSIKKQNWRTLIVCLIAVFTVMAISLVFSLQIENESAYADEYDAQIAEINNLEASVGAELDINSNSYYECVANKEQSEKNLAEAKERLSKNKEEQAENQKKIQATAKVLNKQPKFCFLITLFTSTNIIDFVNNMELMSKTNQDTANLVADNKRLGEEYAKDCDICDAEYANAQENAAKAWEVKLDSESKLASLENKKSQLKDEQKAKIEAQRKKEAEESMAAAARASEAFTNSLRQRNNSSSGSGGSTISGGNLGGGTVVERARSCIGRPYGWGKQGPESFDCSGLCGYALTGSLGAHQYTTATFNAWPTVSDPTPGDICVIHNGSQQHCGVYIGNGQMIHAPCYGQNVCVTGVQAGMKIVRAG